MWECVNWWNWETNINESHYKTKVDWTRITREHYANSDSRICLIEAVKNKLLEICSRMYPILIILAF